MPRKIIFDGSWKGLADSKFSGVRGSFAKAVGIDGHTIPGVLQVHQKLAKDSGTTVDAFAANAIAASDGSTLWFSRDSGKIWRRTAAGAWSLAHTTTPAAGATGCLGAAQYDGKIYWATQNSLHFMLDSDLNDSSWAGNTTEDWATFANTDTEFHPMIVQSGNLYIGDQDYVASVVDTNDTHVFTDKALDIKKPHKIKSIIDYDIDILLGTFIHANVNKCAIVRWNTEDVSWQNWDEVEENGVNCFIRDDNFVYAQAGNYGKIYFYNGEKLEPFIRIPGDYSPTASTRMHNASATTFLGLPRFGLSNDTGNPTDQGVYTFGSYSRHYGKVLDLSFPISGATDSTLTVNDVEVGAILGVGADLFAAWKDYSDSSYGVDQLNYSAKLETAYLETMLLSQADTRDQLKTINTIRVNHAQIPPASTSVAISYKDAFDASYDTALVEIQDTHLMQTRSEFGTIPKVANPQIRLDFTVATNNTPQIESISYTEEEIQDE